MALFQVFQFYTSINSRKKIVFLLAGANILIEEDVAMVCVAGVLLRRTKEGLNVSFIHHLHILVVKEEPVVVALDEADVVAMVGAASDVHDDGEERVLGIRILDGVAELQFEGEDHSVRQLLVPPQLFYVLETLQMDDQHVWRPLYLHSLLGFLQAAAFVTEELVLGIQSLCRTEVFETACNGTILLYIKA